MNKDRLLWSCMVVGFICLALGIAYDWYWVTFVGMSLEIIFLGVAIGDRKPD